MAMTKCKECGKDVSTSAITCPHCGVANPGVNAKNTNVAKSVGLNKPIGATEVIIAAIVIVFGIWLMTEFPSTNSNPAKMEDGKCKSDLQCWGDKNIFAAGAYCKNDIEKLAKFSARWSDGVLKFSRSRWLNKEQATLTFIGDKIEFQNGFGAYQNHIYECDFDPASNTVLDVRATPGRL